jgi:NADH-quinone oxidoreductase subunit L
MGGLRKKMPAVFITFLIGSASLSALPLVTAGFYSKDQILWYAFSSDYGSVLLWVAGIIGALLTALYSFRMIFITFYGEAKTEPAFKPGKLMIVPVSILAFLSVTGGFVEMPESLGNVHLFSGLLDNTLPRVILTNKGIPETFFQVLSALIVLAGVYLAYLVYLKKPEVSEPFRHSGLHSFFEKGWGFDTLYETVFVRPVVWLSEIDKKDFIDIFNKGLAQLALFFNTLLVRSQNGKLRWYLMSLAVGITLILTYMLTR